MLYATNALPCDEGTIVMTKKVDFEITEKIRLLCYNHRMAKKV